jgi:hypothetical protein
MKSLINGQTGHRFLAAEEMKEAKTTAFLTS